MSNDTEIMLVTRQERRLNKIINDFKRELNQRFVRTLERTDIERAIRKYTNELRELLEKRGAL